MISLLESPFIILLMWSVELFQARLPCREASYTRIRSMAMETAMTMTAAGAEYLQ